MSHQPLYKPLTPTENARLAQAEAMIKQGLAIIRDEKLHEGAHPFFSQYIAECFGTTPKSIKLLDEEPQQSSWKRRLGLGAAHAEQINGQCPAGGWHDQRLAGMSLVCSKCGASVSDMGDPKVLASVLDSSVPAETLVVLALEIFDHSRNDYFTLEGGDENKADCCWLAAEYLGDVYLELAEHAMPPIGGTTRPSVVRARLALSFVAQTIDHLRRMNTEHGEVVS